MKIKSFLMFFIPLWLTSEPAIAGCNPMNNFENKTIYFNFPEQIRIKPDLPVNSVIHEMRLADQGVTAGCQGTVIKKASWKNNVWGQAGDGKIIETNIPGIGAELYFDGYLYQFPYETKNSGLGFAYYGGLRPLLRFIKTKESIQGGEIRQGIVGTYENNRGETNELYTAFTLNLQSPVKVMIPSCEVQGNPNKVVNFGTVVNKKLASINNNYLRDTEKEFSIDLKCNPGTKVSVTYNSSDKDPYLQSSVINRGTAKGIYVTFYDIGKLGQTNTVITSSGEVETIKQKVSLFRYGTFKSGSISAQATYTLSYQ